MRRNVRAVERQAHYGRGRAAGVAHRLRQGAPHVPDDDMTLVDKVRSEALGPLVDGPHLTVDASRQVVTLRGQVADHATARAIEGAVRAVPGVPDVVNLLHAPGEPAPRAVPMRTPPRRALVVANPRASRARDGRHALSTLLRGCGVEAMERAGEDVEFGRDARADQTPCVLDSFVPQRIELDRHEVRGR